MKATSTSGWRKVSLKEVCTEITVGHVGPMANQYVEDGISFLRSQNVRPFKLDLEDVKFITPDFHALLRKSAIHPGDVVVTRTGANTGQACIIPPSLSNANCADLVIIRPSKALDPRFLSYLLNSEWGRATIDGHLAGAAQHHFNIGAAREMSIALPPEPTQRKIGNVLSAYDDLIENNTRRIKILEEMAQALYCEWFVNFRFPGHEKVKLVDSPLGKIPEGWTPETLGDIVDLSREGISPSRFEDEMFAHFSIPAFDEGCMPTIERGSLVRSNKFLLSDKCVLLSKLNPRIPRIWLPFFDNTIRAITSTEFLVLIPKVNVTNVFLFCMVKSREFLDAFAGRALGTSTSHQRVKPEDFLRLPIVLAPKGLIASFTDATGPVTRAAHILRMKNSTLRHTRDLLLPKLISGEIDVSQLDIETEAVAV